MKVLKKGINPDSKPKKMTCYKCKSELEYTSKDIVHDPRDGDFIKCPVCSSCSNVRSIQNTNRLDD